MRARSRPRFQCLHAHCTYRTFAVAFTRTNAGGEIDLLDTAGYGPLTINKAISIVNDRAIAGVLAPSLGPAITNQYQSNGANKHLRVYRSRAAVSASSRSRVCSVD
jgi:hypothetical protein